MAKVRSGARGRVPCPARLRRGCWKHGCVPCDRPRRTPCAEVQRQGANSGISRGRTCLLHMWQCLVLWCSPSCSVLPPGPAFVPVPLPLRLCLQAATGGSKARPSLRGRSCSGETNQKAPRAAMAPAGTFSSHTPVLSLKLLLQPWGRGES